ncbi:DNRLRE domain-containing protein [Paenibacillus sp. GCM10027626]|uniref:CBM96 family carbohydrate-binding protein n=1 Tax=Paenibacillus sp. GCM10027626 TaxID=3273411 RepID=UPI00362F6BA4
MRIGRQFAQLAVLAALLLALLPQGTIFAERGADPPVNLIANGSFEQSENGKPAGWNLWSAAGTTAAVAAVEEQYAVDQSRSLRLTGAESNTRSAMGQVVEGIRGDTLYEIRAWVKTENVVPLTAGSPAGTLRLQSIINRDGQYEYTGTIMVGKQSGTTDWTLLKQQFTTPPEASALQVQLFLWEASGAVWFDQVELVRVKEQEQPGGDGLPAGADIVERLKLNHPNKSHPRLLASEDDFVKMRSHVLSDPYMKHWHQVLQNEVHNSFSQPLPAYVLPDGYRLLETSRRVLNDIQRLAILYKIDEDKRCLERMWAILEAAGSFPDWNPQHFLDVAEMTNAFALAYDWFYDDWTEEQRNFLREAIVTKGLQPAAAVYRGEIQGDFGRSGWLTAENNWNTVVNSGMAMGALAVADESEQLEKLTAEVLEGGLRSIQLVLPLFQPDGAGEEGIAYWEYNARYLVYYMASLQSALGTDYGMSESPGIEQTAYFPIYLGGPGGSFNYGNNNADLIRSPILFWFAKRYNDPDLAWYQRTLAEKSGGAFNMLWYDPEHVSEAADVHMGLDRLFRKVEAGSMRSSWDDPKAFYVGFKGGNNTFNHNHLDVGSFVLDALGVRWAGELGPDDYNLPDYFGLGGHDYYRIRTEGQNTLVLNPGRHPGQEPSAAAAIVDHRFSAEQAYMIADLTAAYQKDANEVRRGIALLEERRMILLQDEVKMKQPDGELLWFMHTKADVEIMPDGQSAMLSRNGERLWAHIIDASQPVSFQVRDAKPLPTSPAPGRQAVNEGVKLAIQAKGIEELQLAVLFVPLHPWENIPAELPPVTALAEWGSSQTATPARVRQIQINGAELTGFKPDQYTYHVQIDTLETASAVPQVEAVAADSIETEVIPADVLPGTTVIRAFTADGSLAETKYYIHWEGGSELIVTASDHDGNEPINTLDGDWGTRWSAQGEGQWIQYKLDQERMIDHVKIAFFSGAVRSTLFDILLSQDGVNWKQVYSGQSSGQTTAFERFSFPAEKARYVRIVGKGNTVNNWNSITEAEIEGVPRAVKADRLGEITLQASNQVLKIGDSAVLQVKASLSSGTPLDINQVKLDFVSSNPAVAAVGDDGVIRAVEAGTATIIAQALHEHYWKWAAVDVSVDDGGIRIAASADTYVQGGKAAATNFGSSAELIVKGDLNPDYRREALIRFPLGQIEGTIEQAKLYIYALVQDTAGDETDLYLFGADSNWEEKDVTWDTKPEVREQLGSVPVDRHYEWREADVTEYVKQCQQAGADVNIALLQGVNGEGARNVTLRSKESAGYGPYLKVYTACLQ